MDRKFPFIAVTSRLLLACTMRIRQAILGATLAALGLAMSVLAAAAAEFTFEGVVAPRQTLEIANQIDGVVQQIHVTPGQRVRAGELLVTLEDADAEIELAIAKAALKEAEARKTQAHEIAQRRQALASKGAATRAAARDLQLGATIASAVADRATANLRKAELALTRTRVRAPISGTVGQVRVSPGAFVEAEGGTVLLEINTLDPVLVSYTVSYEDRQRALEAAGVKSIAQLFGRLELGLRLPSGASYPHAGRTLYESDRIEEAAGGITVWGEFPNPDRTLVPGLPITITSRVRPAPDQER